MKLIDEVKLKSSVEALEALCADLQTSPQWPAIRQNLDALRELLRDASGVAVAPGEPKAPSDADDGPRT